MSALTDLTIGKRPTWVLDWAVPGVAAAALLGLAAFLTKAVPFDPAADALKLLTPLMIVALVFERSLEVYVSFWRDPEASRLLGLVEDAEEAVKFHAVDEDLKARPEAYKQREAELVERKQRAMAELKAHRARTRVIAMRTSFVLGLALSAVGLRFLVHLLDGSVVATLAPAQRVGLRLLDTLTTGGVIAGGSEGLHRIITAVTDLAQLASKSAGAR